MIPQLRTARLLLRGWREADREPFAAIGADPEAMRYYPSPLTPERSYARIQNYREEWNRCGLGKWAVEIPGATACAGAIGLGEVRFTASFTPCIEIGWRLARSCWGQGYATEGARAALEFGFERLGLEEIVAFTIPDNTPSLRVMAKLSMRYAGQFAHPSIAADHPCSRHRLYRLSRAQWLSGKTRPDAQESAPAADGNCIGTIDLRA